MAAVFRIASEDIVVGRKLDKSLHYLALSLNAQIKAILGWPPDKIKDSSWPQ
jgi:hypothetical protein